MEAYAAWRESKSEQRQVNQIAGLRRAARYRCAMVSDVLDDQSPVPLEAHMRVALRQARVAAEAEEVPIGAAIYHQGRLIAQAHNQVETLKDPTAHAEMIAITQAASALGDWRLNEAVLYVTKEPCPMCAGAIVLARIACVIWGVSDPQRGGGQSVFGILQHPTLNHRTQVIPDFMEEECRSILVDFFRARRNEASGIQPPT